ncbi:MAG TPA: hypothetical protein VD815_04425 [Candidatus Saccharimonadales bacterium]|nr:hypothetical protein [Candidatus Saccharimonadales bacterium]
MLVSVVEPFPLRKLVNKLARAMRGGGLMEGNKIWRPSKTL